MPSLGKYYLCQFTGLVLVIVNTSGFIGFEMVTGPCKGRQSWLSKEEWFATRRYYEPALGPFAEGTHEG